MAAGSSSTAITTSSSTTTTSSSPPHQTLHAAPYDKSLIPKLSSLLTFEPGSLEREAEFFTDESFGRFLVARSGDVAKAAEIMQFSLDYRLRTNISNMTFVEDRELITREGCTGKIYMCGSDCHGRPIIVFDNSCQNTKGRENQMKFLAFYFELAVKQMAVFNAATSATSSATSNATSNAATTTSTNPHRKQDISKWVIFMNMSRFSIFNNPPFKTTLETIDLMTKVYCERMGLVVVFNTPSFFFSLYKIVRPFLDEKTIQKVVITGPAGVGSDDDMKLRRLLGEDWRSLCNAETCYAPGQRISPGFKGDDMWQMTEKIETEFGRLGKERRGSTQWEEEEEEEERTKELSPAAAADKKSTKPKKFRPKKLLKRASGKLKEAMTMEGWKKEKRKKEEVERAREKAAIVRTYSRVEVGREEQALVLSKGVEKENGGNARATLLSALVAVVIGCLAWQCPNLINR
jgi:hypothetical protein